MLAEALALPHHCGCATKHHGVLKFGQSEYCLPSTAQDAKHAHPPIVKSVPAVPTNHVGSGVAAPGGLGVGAGVGCGVGGGAVGAGVGRGVGAVGTGVGIAPPAHVERRRPLGPSLQVLSAQQYFPAAQSLSAALAQLQPIRTSWALLRRHWQILPSPRQGQI